MLIIHFYMGILKLAPRALHKKLSKSFIYWGFLQSKADTSMFVFKNASSVLVILVYVNDTILIGSDTNLIQQLIQHLNAQFTLKDLGDLHFFFFFGIEATQTPSSLHLDQRKYISDLLSQVSMIDSKQIATPMAFDNLLSLHDGIPIDG